MIHLSAWRPEIKAALKPSVPVRFGNVAPLKDNGANKRFAVVGDTGTGDIHQYVIGRRMWETYQRTPFNHVVMLGDNVYENGEPQYFEARLQRPYRPLLDSGVEFDSVLGNHDVRKGYGDEQLKFLNKPRWYNFKIGNAGDDVEFFAIDTTIMAPLYDNAYANELPRALRLAKEQRQWLETALSQSTAKYKIVYGHYPLYSSGAHSYKNTTNGAMRAQLGPVLAQYGVDAYLSGHEHLYERSAPIEGTTHFVSGGGGKITSVMQAKADHPRETVQAKYHFMLFEITPQGLAFEAINRKGNVMDKGVIPPKSARQLAFA